MGQRHRRCRCGKLHSRTLDQARLTHAKIWAEKGGDTQVRYYTCSFKAVHWTRQL